MKCRNCKEILTKKFVDLGTPPHANNYLKKPSINTETFPLKIFVCEKCWLVQTIDYISYDKIFSNDYAYFSSTSSSWLKHAKEFVTEIITELSLNKKSFVVEIASNDGYLLQNFLAHNISNLGIEPTKSTANVAKKKGIEVFNDFFSQQTAEKIIRNYKKADLIIGNNVYAHVPDINDFTKAIKILLKKMEL